MPSARFRVRQYIGALRLFGVEITEFASRVGSYPPAKRASRVWWGICALGERFPDVLRSHRFDVTLLQRELLSTLVTLEPLTNSPRILDVDDAIWLYRGGHAARRLARLTDRIICGNAYLADWFGALNKNVGILPTGIDTERYVPRPSKNEDSPRLVIGWIGTSPNLRYLRGIEQDLATVLRQRPNAELHVVCDQAPSLPSLDQSRLKFVPWAEDIEIASLQQMDIGIMPLEDSMWARGKCSFKMLQYMACGLPSVVSPVGTNAEILRSGNVAIGASEGEWVEALTSLIDDRRMRAVLGAAARRMVEEHYSVRALAPRFAAHLKRV